MLIKGKRQLNSRIFREVIMVGGWTIWCHGNAIIFDGAVISLGRWKDADMARAGNTKPTCQDLLTSII
jgi:hypothetical protein